MTNTGPSVSKSNVLTWPAYQLRVELELGDVVYGYQAGMPASDNTLAVVHENGSATVYAYGRASNVYASHSWGRDMSTRCQIEIGRYMVEPTFTLGELRAVLDSSVFDSDRLSKLQKLVDSRDPEKQPIEVTFSATREQLENLRNVLTFRGYSWHGVLDAAIARALDA